MLGKLLTPWMIVRLCLLAMVWGGTVYGSASVVRGIVESRMPGMERYVRGYVVSYQQALLDSSGTLDTLLDDGRLQAALNGNDGMNDSGIRRVLYEYRYLHPDNQLGLHDVTKNIGIKLEGGPSIEPDAATLARLQSHSGRLAWLAGSTATPMLVVARPVKNLAAGNQVVGLLATPMSEVFKNLTLPTLPVSADDKTDEKEKSKNKKPQASAVLASTVGTQVWALTPGTAARVYGSSQLLDLGRASLMNDGGQVIIVRPLPRMPGWAVILNIPLETVAGLASKLRLGMMGLAAIISVFLFWHPGMPGRLKKAAKTTLESNPAMGRVAQQANHRFASFTEPLRNAMRRMTEGESLIDAEQPMAAPAEVHGGAGPQKVKGMGGHKGSSVHQKAMALGGGMPDRPPPPPIPVATTPRLPEDELRELVENAIRNDTLALAYQPIYSTADSEPKLHEVYVRLPGPSGNMEAHNFLPQAAELGLMPLLDAQVFRKVLRDHFGEGRTPATPVALNLASTTMDGIGYLEEILKINEPRILTNLVFEVRSVELLQDPKAMSFLKKCQALGVKLAVDYFGGGKTMLEATKQLGFDYVKLDALHFWYHLPRRKELVGLARVAQSMHLPMILEKIENIQMEVMARKVGIPYLQGYHLQRPGPALVTEPLQGWREVNAAGSQPAEAAAPPSGPALSSATPS
ncbi:MAG TPA: EAL domain-containing protein [Alphaproteobacteria bacterium]|nr:EAL domain-containing protein [Alphaproteobacteria bacterium]